MFEALREHKKGKTAQVILALFTLPFIFFGLDSYFQNFKSGVSIAVVGDQKISQQEFSQTLKDQQERMRASLGKNFDPAIMDQPGMRQSILDSLVNQRLILTDAASEGLAVSDAQLARYIAGADIFHEKGVFSQMRYDAWLRQQNMSEAMFVQRLRQDMLVQATREGVARAATMPKGVSDNLIRLMEQQREVSQAPIPLEQFMSQVKPDSAAIKAYYDKHQNEFKVPEQARLEYVILSAEKLLSQVDVSDDEITSYYKEHAAQFTQAEERRASHILISIPANASAADKNAAQDKARKVWQEAKQNPGHFAQLAKQYSQDPGSAQRGGDLGFFARGAMAKPFEDAAFKMAEGEIGEPVQSDFGYHIIKLVAVKPGKARTLPEVRSEIMLELKKQKAGKKFTENAENFSNLVYEQGDSLNPVAQQLGLKVEQSAWMSRMASDTPMLNNAKLLQAAFSEEVLNNKRNTEAIEVAPNTLVAARLLEYKPASVKPLDEVATMLAQRLQRQQAAALAVKWGKDALAQLQQGKMPSGLNWSQPQLVSRSSPAGLDQTALKETFRLGADKLPGYVGVENAQGGFTLIKVSRIVEGGAMDEDKKRAYAQRFANLLEQEYAAVYLASLKQKIKVEIKREALEKSEH